MTILWLNWKDITHPHAGGAELVNHELMERLAQGGHQVTLLTSRPKNSSPNETINGVRVIRIGANKYLHSFAVLIYYLKYLRSTFDLVIETVNTAPYFVNLFIPKNKCILLYHQLAREIWFHETLFPLSIIGYTVLEPIALFVQSRKRNRVIALSQSTKKDLIKFGSKAKNIHIISEGISLLPLDKGEVGRGWRLKYPHSTILAFGSIRSMKRTHHIIQAFEIIKSYSPFHKGSVPTCRDEGFNSPFHKIKSSGSFLATSFKKGGIETPVAQNFKLIIAGKPYGKYGRKVLRMIQRSPYKKDIVYIEYVDERKKTELMRRSHLLVSTAVKEGWGLTVTEANSQGTPAVVYNVDGLRDSVRHGETGLITRQNTPAALAESVITLLSNPAEYNRLRRNAWVWSQEINFDKSYKDFKRVVGTSTPPT